MTKCKHNWRFLERWIGDNPNDTEYLFYCTKCLEITSQMIYLKKKK